MSSLELLTCAALIAISGMMSSSEVALFSLSRFQLRALKEHLEPAVHRRIKRLLSDPGGLLVVTLFVNEVINITLSGIITHSIARSGFAESRLVEWITFGAPRWVVDTVLGTIITAPVVLIACEVTPKVMGARFNQLVSGLTATPLTFFYEFLRPVRIALIRVINWASRSSGASSGSGQQLTHGDGSQQQGILKESDFLFMLEEGHREGAIHESELGLVRRVFELDDTPVSEILKPMAEVFTLPSHTTVRAALTAIRAQKYSRIPLIGQNRRVVGVLYSKDIIRARLEPELMSSTVTAVMRKPLTVSSTLRLNALFRKLKQQRTHLAIVQDPDGLPQGVVTMSDVLEALFEDLLPDDEEGA